MAENKKGFVLYADTLHTVKHLTNEQAGELFKHILLYVNDEEPVSDNPIVNIAFEPIKQQLKRDLKKWEDIRKKRSEAGQKSAEARKNRPTNLTSVESVEQKPTNANKSNSNSNSNSNSYSKSNSKILNNTITANAEKLSKKEEYEFLFNVFWDKYNKKVDRHKCLLKWHRLTEKEIEQIFQHVEKYVESTPDKQYRKNPLSYLNAKSYQNEIIDKTATVNEKKSVSTRYREAWEKAEQNGGSTFDPSLY